MAGSAANAAQAAIFARLSADVTLRGLTGLHPDNGTLARVYDEPRESGGGAGLATFPYVVIGDVIERADNRMGGKVGRILDVMVHAWSEKRGYDEVEDILARVDVLLDNYVALSVSGYTVGLLNFVEANFFRDQRAGNPLRHGVSTYELHLLEN